MMRYRLLKWSVLSISALFSVGGCLCLGATLWALLWNKAVAQQLLESSSIGIFLLIGAMSLLIVAGAVGIASVLRQSQPIVGSFTLLSILTLILSLLGGIWTCVTASIAQEKSLERVVHIVQHDYGQDPSKTAILDIVQQSFHCCGSDGYLSWSTSAYGGFKFNNISSAPVFTVPQSCCVDPQSLGCQHHRQNIPFETIDDPLFIYTKGCVNELESTSIPYGFYVLWTSLAAGTVQIVGIAMSIIFFRMLRYLDNSIP